MKKRGFLGRLGEWAWPRAPKRVIASTQKNHWEGKKKESKRFAKQAHWHGSATFNGRVGVPGCEI